MAGLKTSRANTILNDELSGTLYLALYTSAPTASAAGTEVSGGSYARQVIALGSASAGVKAQTGEVSFPTATAGWGTVVAWAICDASSGGDQIAFRSITPFAVNSGDQVIVPAGNVSVSLA